MVANLVYDGAYAGGRAVDDYVGVKAIAPSLQLVAPSGFGRVWSLAFTGGFFLLGAYRVTLLAFAGSFVRIAPGAPFDAHAWAPYVVNLAGTIVLVGVAVAAPAIGLAFLVQVALGALSRAVPRFGSLTLAFPFAFAAALIATALAVPAIATRDVTPVLAIPGLTK
jgi:flagellar biosynthesis protein FliR